MSFLTKRVKAPDLDDWRKLVHLMDYFGLLWQIWRDVDRCFSPRSSGKLVDMRSLERRDLCMRFWSGRLFLMFCSCFEVDNDSKDTANANRSQ